MTTARINLRPSGPETRAACTSMGITRPLAVMQLSLSVDPEPPVWTRLLNDWKASRSCGCRS